MFDGKMLRGKTGMPMRRKLFANSSFADAEPEPLTLANLMTKSLTASILFIALGGFLLPVAAAAGAGVGHLEQELLHVPGAGRAALGAQAAVQADVLVLHHDAAGLERSRDIEVLREVARRRVQLVPQFLLIGIQGEGDAVHRADVDAGIALDAQPVGEHRLHIAVEAALRLLPRRGDVEAELDLGLHILQRDPDVAPGHLVARVGVDLVVVAPLVDAHLLRHQGDARGRPFRDVLAIEQLVDGNGRVMPVRPRPDDVLRPEGGVAAEEDVRHGGLHRLCIYFRHPFLELETTITLDPGEGVLLADRDEHVVAIEVLVGLARRNKIAAAVFKDCFDFLEHHAGELSILDDEFLRHQVIQDGNPLVLRVLLLPRARLHLLEAGAHDHLDVLAAEALRGAAAVHRGIAAAEHDHALAEPGGMAERHRGEPVDAYVDILRAFLAPGDVQVAPARRARADEEGVIALAHQFLHGRYFSMYERNSQVEDIAHLLVDDLERQAEARDLRPDHAAGARILVEEGDLVAERREIARHGERRRTGADAGDLLAV